MNTKTNNQNVAKSTIRRDSRGRFVGNIVNVKSPGRDSRGRFVGKSGTVVVSKAPQSSFIQSMVVNPDNTVSVVMNRNPKTTYTYKPTQKGLSAVRGALKRGTGLGEVYNAQLRGREVSRTIYR